MTQLLLLAVVGAPAAPAAAGCAFESLGRGCKLLSWDLTGLAAAVPAPGVLHLNDSWPEPYLVAPPCHTVDLSACPACKDVCHGEGSTAYGNNGNLSRCGGASAPVGVQLEPFKTIAGGPDPKKPCSDGSRCYSIGGNHARASPIDPADPELGLHLAYPASTHAISNPPLLAVYGSFLRVCLFLQGGDAGRELHHWIHCDRTATKTTAPATLVAFDTALPGSNVNWTSPLGCPTISKGNCSTDGIVKPTPEQLGESIYTPMHP
jgi:hypothetical protein